MAKHWFLKKFGQYAVEKMDVRDAAGYELCEDVMDKYAKWDADRKRRQ